MKGCDCDHTVEEHSWSGGGYGQAMRYSCSIKDCVCPKPLPQWKPSEVDLSGAPEECGLCAQGWVHHEGTGEDTECPELAGITDEVEKLNARVKHLEKVGRLLIDLKEEDFHVPQVMRENRHLRAALEAIVATADLDVDKPYLKRIAVKGLENPCDDWEELGI